MNKHAGRNQQRRRFEPLPPPPKRIRPAQPAAGYQPGTVYQRRRRLRVLPLAVYVLLLIVGVVLAVGAGVVILLLRFA